MRFEPVERIGKQFIFAVGGGAIDIAGGRADLVRPQQQAAGLLAHVPAGIRFA